MTTKKGDKLARMRRQVAAQPLPPLTMEQADGVMQIIGEGVHTALRKYCDSPQSSVAWKAIRDLPGEEWSVCCKMAAAQILRYLGSTVRHEADGASVLTLADDVPPLLDEWDGMGTEV